MWAIQTTARVALDGTVTVEAPTAIPPGEYHAVLVITEEVNSGGGTGDPAATARLLDFTLDDLELWPGTSAQGLEEASDERGTP